ncbi:MAG: hypothetical protein M1823_005721 [Watsoniomyces obsoletus]|nr:MAG: hypothetical protein M1823_005721 [Watsoniomyces obsoletus]
MVLRRSSGPVWKIPVPTRTSTRGGPSVLITAALDHLAKRSRRVRRSKRGSVLRRPQNWFMWKPGRLGSSPSLKITEVVAWYLRLVHPLLDPMKQHRANDEGWMGRFEMALRIVFTNNAINRLAAKGWTVDDVISCAWVLTSSTPGQAAARLVMLESHQERKRTGHSDDGLDESPSTITRDRPLPIFVVLYVLNGNAIDASALRTLLGYVQRRFRQQRPPVDQSSNMLILERLLIHALRVWPLALPAIAQMSINHLGYREGASLANANPMLVAKVTARFNRMLALLALPSSLDPFVSIPLHERAQFTIVRRMSECIPPLSITQQGYRAVIKIQLARRKTASERHWANQQSRSWPPWKEAKTGMDAGEDGDGTEMGVSRALRVVQRMQQAGYATSSWEQAAAIYAGRDTDDSPTIQTRAIKAPDRTLFRPRVRSARSARSAHRPQTSPDDAERVWEARVRATRTIEEAWACFLAYLAEVKNPPATDTVYRAMLERLSLREWQRRCRIHHRLDRVPPGDSREVHPAPTSPYDGVYVPVAPPSAVDLYEQMIERGVRPSIGCVTNLVLHAASTTVAVRIIERSGLVDDAGLAALLNDRVHGLMMTKAAVPTLRAIPKAILIAFLRRLCALPTRIGWSDGASFRRHRPKSARAAANASHYVSPIVHVARLLYIINPRSRPAWTPLLLALGRRPPPNTAHYHSPVGDDDPLVLDLLCWKIHHQIVSQMRRLGLHPDEAIFVELCRAMSRSASAAWSVLHRGVSSRTMARPLVLQHFPGVNFLPEVVQLDVEAKQVVQDGRRWLRSVFVALVGHHPEQDRAGFVRHDHGSLESFYQAQGRATGSEEEGEPSLLPPLIIPLPVTVHFYVRALGMLRDHEGIEAFLSWLAQWSTEFHERAQQTASGRRLLRRTLIAIRIVLEGGTNMSTFASGALEGEQEDESWPSASDDLQARVRSLIERMGCWGEWPSDQEVQQYLRLEADTPDDTHR